MKIKFCNQIYYLFFLCLIINMSCEKPVKAETEFEDISLNEKIGQMVMIGFRGTELDERNEISDLIRNYNIGGVVLYDRDLPSKDSLNRNIQSSEQLIKLTSDLQNLSPSNLLIGIDEEGGWVSKLKRRYGFKYHQSHQKIGKLNNPDSTRIWAIEMAKELNQHGVNMNFAPVVDLNINPQSPAIGKIERSFSESPDIVIKNSKIFIEEHNKRKIICVPKHFPGHGSARNDSHKGLTDVTSTWNEKELIPYEELIRQGYCDVVMTAHVYNGQLDTFPSTLSSKIINNILRKDFKFNGVIISDDMHMRAITNFYDFEQSVEKAILSGVDILLYSNNAFPCGKNNIKDDCIEIPYNPKVAIEVINCIKKMVESGKISEDRINNSYTRIQKLKEKI